MPHASTLNSRVAEGSQHLWQGVGSQEMFVQATNESNVNTEETSQS